VKLVKAAGTTDRARPLVPSLAEVVAGNRHLGSVELLEAVRKH
jgi:hypothetical protein